MTKLANLVDNQDRALKIGSHVGGNSEEHNGIGVVGTYKGFATQANFSMAHHYFVKYSIQYPTNA